MLPPNVGFLPKKVRAMFPRNKTGEITKNLSPFLIVSLAEKKRNAEGACNLGVGVLHMKTMTGFPQADLCHRMKQAHQF